MTDLKAAALAAIDRETASLRSLSEAIWDRPELAMEEHEAHATLTKYLTEQGFDVQSGYCLETAFKATWRGNEERVCGPNVAVICEYDALPEIGHACGHNLIAEAGCAAAIGIRAGLETSEKPLGRLTIMGTPAEEAIGGKVKMIEQGCFQDIDIALMVHPFPSDSTVATFISVCCLNATFTGKASHAAAFPWEGINALDAAVSAYNAISMLRQQMKPDWRVHGIISNGGAKPNIIPEKSTLEYFVRTPTAAELDVLAGKVKNIFESAAQANGCQVDVEEICRYSNVINNSDLMQLFRSNSESLGVQFDEKERMAGSTDMGNVSHTVPSIHPLYSIGTDAFNHTRHFTAAANTDYAHSKTLIAAKSIAMTAIDVLTNPEMLKKVKATFRCQLQEAA